MNNHDGIDKRPRRRRQTYFPLAQAAADILLPWVRVFRSGFRRLSLRWLVTSLNCPFPAIGRIVYDEARRRWRHEEDCQRRGRMRDEEDTRGNDGQKEQAKDFPKSLAFG
ncbi:unnamed protein product [Cuscuta campestris]|uniref:Uncharacterized protein n=1 Tax=Cuscuta campestris TaxID=132261 RepID=A0A484K3I6_9ASTE|nr:unnamed protein product [Cuscuta campestris]